MPPAPAFLDDRVHYAWGRRWPLNDLFWLAPRRLSDASFLLLPCPSPAEPEATAAAEARGGDGAVGDRAGSGGESGGTEGFGAPCAFTPLIEGPDGAGEAFVDRRWADARVPRASYGFPMLARVGPAPGLARGVPPLQLFAELADALEDAAPEAGGRARLAAQCPAGWARLASALLCRRHKAAVDARGAPGLPTTHAQCWHDHPDDADLADGRADLAGCARAAAAELVERAVARAADEGARAQSRGFKHDVSAAGG